MKKEQRDEIAFQLIDMMAWCLIEINAGLEPIPNNWKSRIERRLNMLDGGRRPSADTKSRNKEVAAKALDYETSIKQWKEVGRTIEKTDGYDRYIVGLAEEYDKDPRTIKRWIKEAKEYAVISVIKERKKLAYFMEELFLSSNEKVPDDIDALIQYPLADKIQPVQRVLDWIEDGKKNEIGHERKIIRK